MSVRQAVLRGVRIGSMLLAALLLTYAAYRVMHEPAGASPARVEPDPAPAVSPKAVSTEAPVSSPGTGLPPPPPPPAKKNRKAVREERVEQPPSSVISEPVKEDPPADEEKADAIAPQAAEQPQREVPEKADAPPLAEDPVQSQGRSKRLLKAVGRFLRIKKDEPF